MLLTSPVSGHIVMPAWCMALSGTRSLMLIDYMNANISSVNSEMCITILSAQIQSDAAKLMNYDPKAYSKRYPRFSQDNEISRAKSVT